MNTPVRMVFHVPSGINYKPTTAYDIKFSGSWKFIQKVIFKILQKIGCVHPHFDEEQLVKSIYFDKCNTSDKIIFLALEQLKYFVNKSPSKILIGRAQFEEIINCEIPKLCMTPIKFDNLVRLSFYNISVEVIPWMDGILVL